MRGSNSCLSFCESNRYVKRKNLVSRNKFELLPEWKLHDQFSQKGHPLKNNEGIK